MENREEKSIWKFLNGKCLCFIAETTREEKNTQIIQINAGNILCKQGQKK